MHAEGEVTKRIPSPPSRHQPLLHVLDSQHPLYPTGGAFEIRVFDDLNRSIGITHHIASPPPAALDRRDLYRSAGQFGRPPAHRHQQHAGPTNRQRPESDIEPLHSSHGSFSSESPNSNSLLSGRSS